MVLVQGGKTYEELKQNFSGETNGVISLEEELAKYSKKYPYEVLVRKIVPEGVDVVNKEVREELTFTYFQPKLQSHYTLYFTVKPLNR